MDKSIGQIAFESWIESCGGNYVSKNGRWRFKTWEQLSQKGRDLWEESEQKKLDNVDMCGEFI